MVQYLHFRILEFPLISRSCLFYLLGVAICTCHRFEPQVLNRQKAEFPSRIAPWNFKGCHVPGKTLELSWECPLSSLFSLWKFHCYAIFISFSMWIIIRIIITTTIIIVIFQTPIYFYIHVLFVYLFIHWFIRSFIHSFILSFFHSFMHLIYVVIYYVVIYLCAFIYYV